MKISNFKKINLLAVSFLVSLLAVSSAASAASFEDNTLIRGKDGKIFVVRQGQRVKVNPVRKVSLVGGFKPPTATRIYTSDFVKGFFSNGVKDLAELKRDFRGKKIINVDDKTLAEIKIKMSNNRGPSANSGPGSVRSGSNRGAGGIKSDNSLIRGRDGKVFVTVQGERRHISDLRELRREHAGEVIHNIDDATLNRFPRVLEDNPDRLFDDNSLIRSRDGKIFVIEDDGRRQIEDLNELRLEHLGQAIHDVDDDVVRELELRGRNNEAGEDVRGNADEFELRGRANEPNEDVRGNADENEIRGRRGDDADDFVDGVKLRGDGTVDDNSTDSGRNRGSDGGSSSGRDGSSGGSSGSSGGSSDD